MTFRVRTTSPRTGTVGVAKLRDGATEAEFRARMRQVFAAEEPAAVIRASRELMATVDQLGGAAPHPGADSDFTLRLRPGKLSRTRIPGLRGCARPKSPAGR